MNIYQACKILVKNSQPFGKKSSENLKGVKIIDAL